MPDRKPHPLTSAKAFYSAGGQLALVIECPSPPAGSLLGLDRSPLAVEPPAFELYSYPMQTGVPHIQLPPPLAPKVLTTASVQFTRVFQIGVARDTVRIYHAGGTTDVPVVDLHETAAPAPAHAPDGSAEGYGESHTSFDEAFDAAAVHALAKLPKSHVIDGMDSVEVIAAGSNWGGFVGFVNRKWVRVRARRDGFPAAPGSPAGAAPGLTALNSLVAAPPAPAPKKTGLLKLTLAADPPEILVNLMPGPGTPHPQPRDVRLTLTVHNPSKTDFHHTHPNSGVARFAILNGHTPLWSEPQLVLQVLTDASVAPGQSRTYHATWHCPDVRQLLNADLAAVAEFVPTHDSATIPIAIRIAM